MDEALFLKICKDESPIRTHVHPFIKAVEWATKYHARPRARPSGNEVISELIYGFTGQERSRQAVASHLQISKGFLYHRGTGTVDRKQASEVVKPRPAVSYEKSPVLIENSENFCIQMMASRSTAELARPRTFSLSQLCE